MFGFSLINMILLIILLVLAAFVLHFVRCNHHCLQNYCRVGDYYENLMNSLEQITGPLYNIPSNIIVKNVKDKINLKQKDVRHKKIGEVEY